MESWLYWTLTGALALCAAACLGKLLSLRHFLRECARELSERMATDTNTLIAVSTGDRAARRFAAEMNGQLRALRRERRRLQNGDAELKTAVTNISHDLRTPLTAISGYLDLLEHEALPDEARRYLSVVRERSNAMKALTEELFRYSMLLAATDEMRMEPLSFGDALEESLAGCYGALTARGITPRIEIAETPVVRRLDRAALRRVLDNILANAVKYSDGDLYVRLGEDGTIECTNRAKNLSSVQVQRLFDRFYTVESARNATGLGLSIARMLTERMGGEIRAEYENDRLCILLRFM